MSGALPIERRTRVVEGITPDAIPFAELIAAQEPVILKGLVRDWPLVRAGREGRAEAIAYLKQFDAGAPSVAYRGEPGIGGRFFYDESVTGLNFAAERMTVSAFLDRVAETIGHDDAPSWYMGSTDLGRYLPGLREASPLVFDADKNGGNQSLASIWLGNRTIASAHYDMSNNLACVAVGRRRFTLFPPDQVANLYPGPLDPTPGGQVVSMVDFRDPDFDRHPRFRDALASAQVAELEPGDALIYPALWWHHVEALAPLNMMLNYWWNAAPAFMDTPQNTLLHALLSLRDRSEHEKQGWRALFDYYVFGPAGQAGAHLPEAARGPLAPLDATAARRLRAMLINRLNR